MIIEKEDLIRLCDFLEKKGCYGNGDYRFTRQFLKGKGFDLDSTTIEWLEEHGGFCDCEVYLNVCLPNTGRAEDSKKLEECFHAIAAQQGKDLLKEKGLMTKKEEDFCQWCGKPVKERKLEIVAFDLKLHTSLRKAGRKECGFYVLLKSKDMILFGLVDNDAPPEMGDITFACCSKRCEESLEAFCVEGDRLKKIKDAVLEGVRDVKNVDEMLIEVDVDFGVREKKILEI